MTIVKMQSNFDEVLREHAHIRRNAYTEAIAADRSIGRQISSCTKSIDKGIFPCRVGKVNVASTCMHWLLSVRNVILNELVPAGLGFLHSAIKHSL